LILFLMCNPQVLCVSGVDCEGKSLLCWCRWRRQ